MKQKAVITVDTTTQDSASMYSRFVLVSLLLLTTLSSLLWFIIHTYKLAMFNSDSAAKVLLAQEIIQSGQYFPSDWNYANGDLFVLFGHTFILPLLKFFPAGYTVHAISSIISAVLILLSVWLVSGLMRASTMRRMLLITIFSAGFSSSMAESLFGQVSYGTVVYMFCFTIYFAWKTMQTDSKIKYYFGCAVACLLILSFWQNPQRGIIFYIFPLLCAVIVYEWRQKVLQKEAFQCRHILSISVRTLMSFVIVGAVTGSCLYFITLSKVQMDPGIANLQWSGYEEILKKITHILPRALIDLFDGLPTAGSPVTTEKGLYAALRLFAVLAFFVLAPMAIFRVFFAKRESAIFLATIALSGFLIIFFVQITTNIPFTDRYLIPAIVLCIVIVATLQVDFKKSPFLYLAQCMIVFIFLTNTICLHSKELGEQVTPTSLGNFLVSNGLTYGYASYWNAGIISVLSNEKALVRQIMISDGVPSPYRWLSADHWYKPEAYKGETFLLLTLEEAKNFDWQYLELYSLKPVRYLEFMQYKIFIFAENIANALPGWDTRYDLKTIFPASKYSLKNIGDYVENVGTKVAMLVANKGDIGCLHYGPYVKVEPGDYKITFDMLAKYNPKGVFVLDVSSFSLKRIPFVEKLCYSAEQPEVFSIHIDKAQLLEFRVMSLGNEVVIFKSVSIERNADSKVALSKNITHGSK